MAEQLFLPNPNPNNDGASDIIETNALARVEEQFEVKKKIRESEKAALIFRAKTTDDEFAEKRIVERFDREEKYHEIRLSLAKKLAEEEDKIAKMAEGSEKTRALLALERHRKDIKFEEIKTQAAERYEAQQTRIGNFIDDITNPTKFLKRKAKEAVIHTIAHLLRMRREKEVETQRIEGMKKSFEVAGEASKALTVTGVSEDASFGDKQITTVSDDETKAYYASMLRLMSDLTESTEESTAEQIRQNKKSFRVSQRERLGGPDDTPLLATPTPVEKKKKPGMMGKLADMDPMKSVSGLFGSLLSGLGSVGKMILNLGSKLLIPLVTNPIGWAVILGGIAIGALWTFKDQIAEAVGSIWEGIKEMIGKVVGFITDMFKGIGNFYKKILKFVLPESVYNWLFSGDEEDAKNKEIANERMGGDQEARQKSQKDVYREMDARNSNPHYDEPWGKFYKAPTGAKAGKPRYEKSAISKAKMEYKAAQLKDAGLTSGTFVGGRLQQKRQAQNAAVENAALDAAQQQGMGAQAQGNNNMLNAPTTNIHQTIHREYQAFDNDPTRRALQYENRPDF